MPTWQEDAGLTRAVTPDGLALCMAYARWRCSARWSVQLHGEISPARADLGAGLPLRCRPRGSVTPGLWSFAARRRVGWCGERSRAHARLLARVGRARARWRSPAAERPGISTRTSIAR